MYGIPNMKLPKDVVERRTKLMDSCGIELRCGCDVSDTEVAAQLLDESDAVVVAVGARQARCLAVPGADAEGVVLSVPAVIGSNGVEIKVPLRLNYEEKRQMKESADAMRAVMAEVEL